MIRLCARADSPFGRVARPVCDVSRFMTLAHLPRLPSAIRRDRGVLPAGSTDVQAALLTCAPSSMPAPQEVDLVLPYRALMDGDEGSGAPRRQEPHARPVGAPVLKRSSRDRRAGQRCVDRARIAWR